jgi:hypothetical protein
VRAVEGARVRRPAFRCVMPSGAVFGFVEFGEGGEEGEGALVWAVSGSVCWRVKAQLEGVKVGG